MLWIPYLSISIFAVVTLAMIIVGFRKGWRYSLIFSIFLLILTLALVGLSYLLYNVIIWRLFRDLILQKVSSGIVDVNLLKSFYKSSAILLVTGLEMPITYLLAFLFMRFVWTKIEKFMGPKVKERNNYSKYIVFRRKVNLSRVSGAAILGVFTIFSASALASSLNIITTPLKRNNFMNKFNNTIGGLYTFNLASNSDSSQIVTYFIANVNSTISEGLTEPLLFELKGYGDTNNKFINVSKINDLGKFLNLLKTLSSEKKATEVIISSLHSGENKINPLGLDREILGKDLDSNNDVIGLDRKDETLDFDALEKFLKENPIRISLPEIIRDVIFSEFIDSFIGMDNTKFEEQIKESQLNLSRTNDEIKKREKDSAQAKEDLKSTLKERKILLERLIAISGGSYSPSWEKPTSITIAPSSLADNDADQGSGLFKRYRAERKKAKTDNEKAKDAYDKAEKIYGDYHKGEYKKQKDLWDAINREINGYTSRIKELTRAISDLDNEILNKNNLIVTYTNQKANNEAKIISNKSKITILQNSIEDLKQERTETQRQRDHENTLLKDWESKEQKEEVDWSKTSGKISDYNNEIKALDNDISELKRKIKNASPSEKPGLQNQIDTLEQEKHDKNNLLISEKNKLKQIQANIDKWAQTIMFSKSKLENLNRLIKDKNKEISTKENELNKLTQENQTMTNDNNSLTGSIKNLKTEVETAKNNRLNKKNEKISVESELKNSNEKKSKLEPTWNIVSKKDEDNKQNRDDKKEVWDNKKSIYESKKQLVISTLQEFSEGVIKLQGADSKNGLGTLNRTVTDLKKQIDKLDNIDQNIKFKGPAKEWSFEEDGSIHYEKEKSKFYQAKIKQRQTIYNKVLPIYKQDEERLISLYKNWLYN